MEKAFSDRLKEGPKTPPVAVLVGIRAVSFGGGEAVFEMKADRRHHNPMGTVHGGILCDLSDAAMGYAFASTLEPGESFTTLVLKINFLRPVFDEKLTAKAKVARASSTCSVLRGDATKGR